MADTVTNDELSKAKLNLETAKMSWVDLQRFFAAGMLLKVSEDLDIVDVGHRISLDDKDRVEGWLQDGKLGQVSDDQAQVWFDNKVELWALVVRPWVLVQDKP